jgi:predicted metal-binding protein
MESKDYGALALQLGAAHAVRFEIGQIAFDERTLLKCMFGCADWGKGPTCPSRPGSLSPWDYRRIFERYQWGIIIHSPSKQVSQQVSFAIEREAFLDGYYFAFSLSDCALCAECAGLKERPCANPKRARPAFHSVGIDVFRTVRGFGLPIDTLKDRDQPQNWYSAVFIE